MLDSTDVFSSRKASWWTEAYPLTVWDNVKNSVGKAVDMSFGQFYEHMAHPKTFPRKSGLPGWSPAVFEGNHRKKEKALHASALVLDLEPSKEETSEEGATLEQIQQAWGWVGHLVYASWSHRLPGKLGVPRNCYRLILPMPTSVTTDEYERLVKWAQRLFPLPFDASAIDISRLWYAPALRPELDHLEIGTCWVENLLDPSKILRALPEEPKPERAPYKVEFVASGETNEPYVKAALDKATKAIFDAKDGERNNILNRESYAIGGLVAAQAITEAQARDAIMGAVLAAGWPLPRKNLATFERGLKAGMDAPRQVPQKKQRRQAPQDTWELPPQEEGEPFDDSELPPELEEDAPPPPAPPEGGGGGGDGGEEEEELPEVRLGPDRTRVLDETLEHLGRARRFYQRSCELVEPIMEWIATKGGEKQRANAQIRSIHPDRLEEMMARSINFTVWKKQKEDGDFMPTNPPRWLVNQIHNRGTWETIQPLRGVVESPVLRPDGTLLCTPGYDEATGLIYKPNAKFDPIDPYPTSEKIQESLARLFSLVKDFPFETRAHRSAWLAALLTVLCRPAFSGPAPLFLVDSNVRGAGKTKLVHLIGQIVMGSNVEAMANINDDIEMEKRILGIAKAGYPITMIDDIAGTFGTASLNNALTSTRFRGRTLGVTDLAGYDLLTVWFATGNNVQLFRDLARRVCHMRLLSEEQHPEYRNLPDIMSEVRDNRSLYLNAALSLIMGWFNAGKPKVQVKSWGSFEGWSSLIRQIILWCGEPDPGDTREGLTENSDVEGIALASLLSGWIFVQEQLNCPDGVTVKQVIDEISLRKDQDEELRGLDEAIHALCPNANDRQLPQQLARKLGHLKDRVVQGKCITHGTERSKAGLLWTVRLAKRRAWDASPAPEEALGETPPETTLPCRVVSPHEQRQAAARVAVALRVEPFTALVGLGEMALHEVVAPPLPPVRQLAPVPSSSTVLRDELPRRQRPLADPQRARHRDVLLHLRQRGPTVLLHASRLPRAGWERHPGRGGSCVKDVRSQVAHDTVTRSSRKRTL